MSWWNRGHEPARARRGVGVVGEQRARCASARPAPCGRTRRRRRSRATRAPGSRPSSRPSASGSPGSGAPVGGEAVQVERRGAADDLLAGQPVRRRRPTGPVRNCEVVDRAGPAGLELAGRRCRRRRRSPGRPGTRSRPGRAPGSRRRSGARNSADPPGTRFPNAGWPTAGIAGVSYLPVPGREVGLRARCPAAWPWVSGDWP